MNLPFQPQRSRRRSAIARSPRFADRIVRIFASESREGHRLAVKGRTIGLFAIAGLISFITPYPGVLYYHGLLACFAALGFFSLWLNDRPWRRSWHAYLLVAFDFALLAFAVIYPNPLAAFDYPPQVALRYGNIVYFYAMLTVLAFAYKPQIVLWGGLVGALSYGVGVAWLASLPDSRLVPASGNTPGTIIMAFADPTYVDLGLVAQDIVVFLIVATLLAMIVGRSRRLVWRQAALERERSNLARYFSPTVVDRLAQQDAALGEPRELDAAVMFVDLVGFTSWSEHHTPVEAIELLRDLHGRLEQAVFTHHGTLDKFIGDGMMATFGTPDPGPDDAANALACTHAILEEFRHWDAARHSAEAAEMQISIGVHYGPVVVGDIGTDRRLELAVLGDTVNVASRLEGLTRELGCRAVIGDAVVQAILAAPTRPLHLLEGLKPLGAHEIKGRDEPVVIWTCR
ncbi:MAG: adenylate/guanylate cyclase domain-containing protein [Alphaproteobacteria bacterium]